MPEEGDGEITVMRPVPAVQDEFITLIDGGAGLDLSDDCTFVLLEVLVQEPEVTILLKQSFTPVEAGTA